MKIDGEVLQVIKNMYWEQTATIMLICKPAHLKKNKAWYQTRMCAFPDLLSFYCEMIIQNIEGYPGIKVVGYNVSNLRYTDDTVLIAENKEDLQGLLHILKKKAKRKG